MFKKLSVVLACSFAVSTGVVAGPIDLLDCVGRVSGLGANTPAARGPVVFSVSLLSKPADPSPEETQDIEAAYRSRPLSTTPSFLRGRLLPH